MSDRLMTIHEVAEELKVHWQTVRSYVKQGGLPATKVGRVVRVKESDLRNFLDKKPTTVEEHEIEIRFLTERRGEIEENLIKLGSRVIYHAHVIDHWYVPNEIRDLDHKNEWYGSGKGYGVRVREQDNGYTGNIGTSLEIKRLYEPYKHDTCIEQSISISDFDGADKLLRLMNMKKMVSLDKDRIIYLYKNYKIVFDDVKDFKTGIEIEMVTTEESKKILPKLKKIADQIGINTSEELVEKSITFLYMEEYSVF